MKNPALKIISFFFLLPLTALAQSSSTKNGLGQAFDNAKEVAKDSSLNDNISINSLAGDIIQLALSILGVICVVFIIYAGYLWLTAVGNEQRIEKAKTILFESIIGLIIVIAAYAISYFIIYVFKGQVSL